MPARIARSHTGTSLPKLSRNKKGKRALDAYAAAAQEVPEKRIPQNRLGEYLDDGPRQKRRRVDDDGEDEDEDEDEPSGQKQSNKRHYPINSDDVEHGSDSSGNEWTMGGLAEDDNDSDLDSDEAFGSSDEERFEGFTFRGSSSGKGKLKTQKSSRQRPDRHVNDDLNENSDDEEKDDDSEDDQGIGLGNDAVDLATMLDNSEEDEESASRGLEEEVSSADDDEESGGNDTDSESDEGEEGGNEEERVARMMDRLDSFDSSKQPLKSVTADPLEDLTIEDLLSGIDAANQKRFAGETKLKKKGAKPSAISAPLPKRQQDRLNRMIASEKAKEQLARWKDTVARNRRAEFLSFPLGNQSQRVDGTGKASFAAVNHEAPRTDLEKSIQRIMEESGLAATQNHQDGTNIGEEEAALLKSEELATNQLPVEEVMRRRAELRRARELLFREEIKAKRISKIKSKSYRRVHRKERERLEEQERQALEGLGASKTLDEDEKDRVDRQRAEARMATKHKDSKWAKELKRTNRSVWDEDSRNSVIEMARRKEELQKRIAGYNVSDEDESDVPSVEDESEDGDGDSGTLRQLSTLKDGPSGSSNGLSGLKFMRAAEDRKRAANEKAIQALRMELREEGSDIEGEDMEEDGLGRAIFGPQAKQTIPSGPDKTKRLEFEAPDPSDEENEAHIFTENITTATNESSPKAQKNQKDKLRASGPLSKDGVSSSRVRDADNSKREPRQDGWLTNSKHGRKNKTSMDDTFDLIMDGLNSVPAKSGKPDGTRAVHDSDLLVPPKRIPDAIATDRLEPSDIGSDLETEDPMNGIASIVTQQKSLQQRAFAGDDVEIAFGAEKADLAASEDEKEISNHLPGWGAWTGDGLSKSVRKANKRAKHNPLFKTKVAGTNQADRKDASLKNVIISERQDRKGKKYFAPVLPHEFETKEQYERSRRLPMGPEWTTKEVHQRMTRPRIVTKPGVRMEALQKPLV